jgi:tetratricopeptide (TPR) repeat protein
MQGNSVKKYGLITACVCLALVIKAGTSIYSQIGKDINIRGVELGEKNKLDEAIKEFDKVIELRDNEAARVHHNRAYALEKKGKLRDAIKSYEEALKRNPRQILSGERLGYVYYKTGDYEKAVATGEAVLKMDRNNQQVPQWLPDARAKLKEKLAKAVPVEPKLKEEQKTGPVEKKEDKGHIFHATIDAMLRTGLYFGRKYHLEGLYYTTPHGYRALSDDGLIVDVPYTMFFRITPVPFFELDLTVENPFLGALTPAGLVVQNETLESIFHIKNAIIGAGVMFNHYNSGIAFYRRYILWDYKVGIIVGYNLNNLEAKFTWYPRMLIMDPATSTGKSLDAGLFKIDWTYQFSPAIKFYGMIHARDYYVYNHSKDIYTAMYFAREFYFYTQPKDLSALYGYYFTKSEHISDYWGVYDLGFGVTLDKLLERTDEIQLSVSIEWIERFYLRSLMNKNPYTLLPNGQGLFGLNLDKYTKGKPFSGFRALSHVFGVRFEEQLTRNFFMYQKIILELTDQKADHHEFNLKVGMGAKI